MATDYDAPRRPVEEDDDASLKQIRARRADSPQSSEVDLDESDSESVELPGADLSGEELTVRVVPPQPDEFTCIRCFLVVHRGRRALDQRDEPICRDCA